MDWVFSSRQWALAVPTYAMVTVVLALGFYIGLNFMATPSPTSLNTMFGKLWVSGYIYEDVFELCKGSLLPFPLKIIIIVIIKK